MATETEIKLRVDPRNMDRLAAHPLFAQHVARDWSSRELLNAYYDTEDRQLARAQVALRIRRDGDTLIQTLKTKGASVAGLSERNEWDWYIESEQLVLEHLVDDCWPASLAGLDKSRLQELFRTDFTRQSLELAWEHAGVATRIEVALDRGRVITASGEEPICELELELREGEPATLLELALQLAADLPLMPCDISKAERGYRLLQPDSFDLHIRPAELTAEQEMESALVALLQEKLAASQRLAEQYRHSGQWKLLEQWLDCLSGLRALLGSAGQVVPRKSSHELRLALDGLLADWQPRLLAGVDSRQQRDATPAAFAAELEQTRWGVFSLQLALWLHQGAWAGLRNARASRQAQAPLIRWLPRFLHEEAQALGLEAYKLKPEALPEQLPRLERMLVWLEAARHVLEHAGLDDSLGALRSLHQDMRTGDVNRIRHSLQSVGADRGWKALLRGSA